MAELATNAKNDEEVIAKLHKVTIQAGCDRMLLHKCLLGGVSPRGGRSWGLHLAKLHKFV